ncbi:hypothetical protein BKA64DRAFT_667766 [Cadophora sp. MPI-SDFR-AT-0126]|nr:hypothetical protein BKA64DRAFT_667766 [Leotiomycetes sp. MPI-SDFR-AT-0126]
MESRSPGPALYTQTASSSIVPFEVTETPKATLPASKPSTVASREEPTTVPAISHSNPWQEFAAAEESRASAQDQDTPAASPEILRAAVEALQEAKSAPKASISTARVSSTVPTSLLSPQHAQRTDDALWAAILGSVGSSKSIVQPKPQVPKGNLRHRPSKSDINDRLAKDFSGLNLNTNIAIPVGEAITPISEKSAVAPRPELSEQLTPTPSSRHVPSLRGPSSAALTVVPEASLIAAQTGISMQSTPESSLMPRGQLSPQNSTQVARTPASQAMQRKITVALKQPLVLSPRLSPASSFTRPSSAADPVDSAESQLKTTTDVNKAKTSSPPITLVKSEPELKLGSSNGGVASHFTTMEAQSQGVQVNNPTLSVLSVDSDCRLPAAAEHAKPSDALDDKLNKVLKGAPGLSASKWAAEPATPRLTGPPLPRSHPSSFHPIQQPLHHPQGQLLHQVPTLGYTPIFTTVLVPDGPGRWKEVIGVETHSIPHVAHAPIPQATRPYVENIRPSSGPMGYSSYPASPNFPVLPQTFQHHSSFSSATSESTINPVAPTFKPSPQRTHGSTPVGQRQPLSPSKNLQSQLQSRLNSSMTGPRMTFDWSIFGW